jgi:hypothetical protein
MTVQLTHCDNCYIRTSNAAGTVSVYDVRVIVERPTLRLFLDADNNFNPESPEDDQPQYVPGNDLASGYPVAIPASGTLIQTVKVIAAYVLSNNKIVRPPTGVENVAMTLENTSIYSGIAMNFTPGFSGDLAMPQSVVSFDIDHTARNDLEVRDYAAWGEVRAAAGSDQAPTMRVPRDDNTNGIPDVGWRAADGTVVPDAFADPWEDGDAAPSGDGTPGDGLGAIEEYRGFRVNGALRRLDPGRKDLFVYSTHPQSIGDAHSLDLNFQLLQTGEMDLATRIINPDYGNAGNGPGAAPNPGRALRDDAAFQRGLYVIDGGDSGNGVVGKTPRAIPGMVVPNDVSGPIEIFTTTIRKVSPDDNNGTDVDPFDEGKNNQTLAHEIGHGVFIAHWRKQVSNPAVDCPDAGPLQPDRAPTIMISCWLQMTTDINDPRWNNIPHVYDTTDKNQLRIKKVY